MDSGKLSGEPRTLPFDISLVNLPWLPALQPACTAELLSDTGSQAVIRENIIISRNKEYPAPGCKKFQGLEAALEACQSKEKVFIIGGERIFLQSFPFTDKIILTLIPLTVPGDTFFPEIPEDFFKVDTEEVTGKSPYIIETYKRHRV